MYCTHKTDYGWAVVLPILHFGSVMYTGILGIPVLYLCFGLLAYLGFALAKFVYQRSRKFELNVNSQSANNIGFPTKAGVLPVNMPQ